MTRQLTFSIGFLTVAVLGGLAYEMTRQMDAIATVGFRSREVTDALWELRVSPSDDNLARVRKLVEDNPAQLSRIKRYTPDNAAQTLAAMLDDERAGREQRRLLRMASFDRLKLAISAIAAVALIVLAMASVWTRRLDDKRTSTERGLREVNAFLEAVVENIPNMIFVKEANALRFYRINRAGEALLGTRREQLLGKNDYDFFPHDEAAFFQAKDRQALEGGQIVDIKEEPIETKSGQRWLHTKKVPVHDDAGKPVFLLGISEDITEQKAQAESLRSAISEAEAAARELESFSYSVAHDLRAPLRAIDGFSQALLEDDGPRLTESGKDHLQRVRAAAQRMGRLIDDLLSLSQVTRHAIARNEVDLSLVAQSVVVELTRTAPDRKVRWKIDDRLTAVGDAHLVRIMLDNLLGNAFKFTSKRVEAVIELGRDRDGAFFVRDNGAGFDMQFKDKLFGVFQRLHPMNEFPGTGIGLCTVHRVVTRHGGRIWAEGEVDVGATFYFTLSPERTVA